MANVYGGLSSVVDFVWHWCLGPVVKFPMDTLNTLLLGWLAFGVLIVLLSKFLYDKVLGWDQTEDEYNDYTNQEGVEGTRLPDEGCKSALPPKPPPVVARKATIVPDALPEHVSAPMATGSDPDAVRWINNLLVWFFEGAEGGRIVRDAWNDNLNEFTVGSALETGVLIEVLEFYPQTPAPTLMNIIVDCSPTDDMTITCDMETDLYMRVQTTRTQRDVTTESEYACAVRPLRGRLNVSLRTLQCIAFIKFDGWPEVKMEFEGLRNNAEGLDELQLQEVLKEELTSALRKVTLELDFLSKKSFPRFARERTLPETVIPVGYDALSQPTTSQLSSPIGIVGLKGKRLLVKVVKASGVGGEAGVSSCYSVIEMDDPAQKFTTSVVNDTNSPFWDEQFLFDLSDNTLELLFELYDKSDGRFVGLGIVGIEELVATPSQRQIIPLQPRPYEKDEVTGSLTCEFLFLDRADLPDIAFRKLPKKAQNLETDKVKTSTKTYTIPVEEKNTEEEEDMGGMSGSVGVAEAVLKDLKEKPNGSPLLGPNTRSTVIIHSSRKVAQLPTGEYFEVLNGSQLEGVDIEDDENFKPGVSDEFGTGVVSSGTTSSSGHHQSRHGTHASGTSTNTSENTHELEGVSSTLEIPIGASVGVSTNGLDDDRGRSRTRRKRDFFGSLRRRFSRSKLRSKSVDPTSERVDISGDVTGGRRGDVSLDRDPLAGRSVSMERSASRLGSFGRPRAFLSVPKFIRGRSSPSGGTGVGSGDSESTRSSLSGTSGLSSASAKTYINEASILVVETLENGVIKHYLVPLSLQRKNKWKKKGTKLHIYNEHTFVAKHMSSSISCQVCQKGMGRRLGKQGYECRDCSYKCHKPCHVKTDIICPNSTINSMDLVYVKDDKANNKNSKLNS